MAGWCSVNPTCLKSRKNSEGSESREEDEVETFYLGEVLLGSPLRLAHTAEHMQGICAERKSGSQTPLRVSSHPSRSGGIQGIGRESSDKKMRSNHWWAELNVRSDYTDDFELASCL